MKADQGAGRPERARRPERSILHYAAAVRSYVSENPKARAIDIAGALGCTEAEALSALSDSGWQISGTELPLVLTEVRAWNRVMVLVRNKDGVAEVEVPGDAGTVKGDWLSWIDTESNLHIRIAATHNILALIRTGKRGRTYSFNLANQEGQVFCRFYTRTRVDEERFLVFCQIDAPKTG